MAVIELVVGRALNRWAVMHHGQPLAYFDSEAEAQKVALAMAAHHPRRDVADIQLIRPDGTQSGIRVF